MNRIKLFFSTSAFLLTGMINGQDLKVRVWEGDPPGALRNNGYQETTEYVNGGNSPRISKVTDPELLVYLPEKRNETTAAVIICPGGGYGRLAMDHEGFEIGEWFKAMGVAGIVLKYRLPSPLIMQSPENGPLQDAQEAVRIVRRRAGEWNIDPKRVGIMGFSAGGHLASTLSTHFNDTVYTADKETSARPDFSILIYPVISMKDGITHSGSRKNLIGGRPDESLVNRFSNETRVTSNTPPAFLVHASDDAAVPVQNSLLYYQALVELKIPAEMHLYQVGGHGFGMGQGKGTAEGWPEACKKWISERGILTGGL